MQGYVLGLVGASLALGLMGQLTPRGISGGRLRLISSLCLLCVVLSPLNSLAESLPDLIPSLFDTTEETGDTDYRDILEGSIVGATEEALREALASELDRRFDLTDPHIGLSFTRVEGELRLVRCLVTLKGSDIFKNPHTIEAYLTSLLDCECLVVVG